MRKLTMGLDPRYAGKSQYLKFDYQPLSLYPGRLIIQ